MVHGDRGEKRILTNILQALVYSEHEVVTGLSVWDGPDPIPKGLKLGCDPYKEKYDAVIGWNVNGRVYAKDGHSRVKYIEQYPPKVPVISYYINGMDSLKRVARKMRSRNEFMVPVNTFKLQNEHPIAVNLPVPMVQTVSEKSGFSRRNFMFTIRSGFTDQQYQERNKRALSALVNNSWGVNGTDGKVFILECLPHQVGHNYTKMVAQHLKEFSSFIDSGKIIILGSQIYEQVLRILGTCKMSISLHPVSGTKIQSAAVGCLPTLFSDGWWDKGVGWHLVEDVRGRHQWPKEWDSIHLTKKQFHNKIKYFATNKEPYEALLRKCQKYARNHHTYKAFVNRLVEIVNSFKEKEECGTSLGSS
jgi:hypothetical protein